MYFNPLTEPEPPPVTITLLAGGNIGNIPMLIAFQIQVQGPTYSLLQGEHSLSYSTLLSVFQSPPSLPCPPKLLVFAH